MDNIGTALTTAFTSIAGNVTSVLGDVLPIALGIVGTVIAIRFAVKWFRGLVS
jgi:Flp pilus assembly pilin Flp